MTQPAIGGASCAETLRVLADATRLAVVRDLLAGPKCVGAIDAGAVISQSLLSHHLRVLRDAGLVVAQRSGKAVKYALAESVHNAIAGNTLDLGCCQLAFAPAVEARAGRRAPARKSARR